MILSNSFRHLVFRNNLYDCSCYQLSFCGKFSDEVLWLWLNLTISFLFHNISFTVTSGLLFVNDYILITSGQFYCLYCNVFVALPFGLFFVFVITNGTFYLIQLGMFFNTFWVLSMNNTTLNINLSNHCHLF